MSTSKRLLLLLVVLVTVTVALTRYVDLRLVWEQLRQADVRLVAMAAVALLMGLVLHAQRWRSLVGSGLLFSVVFHAANVGHAVNSLIPLRAGDAARTLALSRSGSLPASQVASSVVVERLVELTMRVAALGTALAIGFGIPASPRYLVGIVLFLALAFLGITWLRKNDAIVFDRGPRLLALLPRLTDERAREVIASLMTGLKHAAKPRRLARALGWSLLAWSCFCVYYALLLLALPVPLVPAQWLAISLGALALMPPSTPAAPGIYHAALIFPLGALGFRESLVTAFTMLAHAVLWSILLALGLWGIRRSAATTQELLASQADA
jgi:glycosyltransferase 2 family protein